MRCLKLATETTNYKLKKPAQDDFYNIDDHNGNMDKIDDALIKLNTAVDILKNNTNIPSVKTKNSAEINALPQGIYFFTGTAPKTDEDKLIAGADYQGLSMVDNDQATQLLFTGARLAIRCDENVTNINNLNYSEWFEFVTKDNVATTYSKGLIRIATKDDILDEMSDAAVTASIYQELMHCRWAGVTYTLGYKVSCMYHPEFYLECIHAGTTAIDRLDTKNVSHGQEILDGTVRWVVRTYPNSVLGKVADDKGNIDISNNVATSFKGRTGDIKPLAGDYTATQITYNDSNVFDELTNLKVALENKVTALESKITELESKVASKSAYLTWGTSLSFKMDKQHPHALVITTNGWVYSIWNSGSGVFNELIHSTNNAQAKPTFVSSGTEADRTVTIKFNGDNAATVIMA